MRRQNACIAANADSSATPARMTDVAHVERARLQLDRNAAASHIGPQQIPCASTCQKQKARAPVRTPYACVSEPIEGREIPRHRAVGHPRAPFEIAVASLPSVAEDETRVRHATAPTEMNALDPNRRGREGDTQRLRLDGRRNGDAAAARPAFFGIVPKHYIVGCRLHDNAIRRATDVEKPTWRHGFHQPR